MIDESIGCYPIHSTQSIEMLEILMKKGVDVTTRCKDGRTLLHQAAKDGNKEMYKYILDNKLIDPEILDNKATKAEEYENW